MKKELNIISMEGEVLLKDNLVRSSILPHTASELDRNVTILADAVVEGAVYANKLEIESQKGNQETKVKYRKLSPSGDYRFNVKITL